jgi:hypothetical protein
MQLWDLVFIDDEHRWTDNGIEPKDPDEGVDCDPIGKLLDPDSEDESDQVSGTWLKLVDDKETYFSLVNQSGRTIKQGEQLFYRYGCSSNASLLLHYNFAYAGNKFDYSEVMLRLKPDSLKAEALVCLDSSETDDIQEARLKTDQLNKVMMAYCRLIVQL